MHSESLQLQVVQAKAETKYAIKEAERAKEAWQFLTVPSHGKTSESRGGAHGSALDPAEHSRATAVEIQKASDL